MKYPLGRIHPHGSGGKSVYQSGGHSSGSQTTAVGWCLAAGAIALGIICLCVFPFEIWAIPVGLFAMARQFLKL